MRLVTANSNKPIYLREIRASDELAIQGTTSHEAILLLDSLLIDQDDSLYNPGEANLIPISDRDYILSQLYIKLYDNIISSTLLCGNCEEKFDVNFGLKEFTDHVLDVDKSLEIVTEDDHSYSLPSGIRFRLPNGDDELAAQNSASSKITKVIIERCFLDAAAQGEDTVEEIDHALAQIAPMIKSNMPASCPECATEQTVHFDIQSYLLQRLLNEQIRVTYELHLLARFYNWSFRDIMEIPRSYRRQYVEFIEQEI